jgi:hypothetical protein
MPNQENDPYFGQDSMTDRLMTSFLALAVESYLLRERVLTLEKVLEKHGILERDAINQYTPSGDERSVQDNDLVAYRERVLAELIRGESLEVD